jgi:hypothetical protein
MRRPPESEKGTCQGASLKSVNTDNYSPKAPESNGIFEPACTILFDGWVGFPVCEWWSVLKEIYRDDQWSSQLN